MVKVTSGLVISLIILSPSLWADEIGQLHNLGYVVVSPGGPDDGGDYGPNTPGTQTSGIQEAFNYAKDNLKEVYIIGGPINGEGETVMYEINTTLTIPWGQDWHIDGGNYVMNFTQSSGDCLVIDSQMNCVFTFGIISAPNLQSGSLVKINPTSVGPDNFIICTSCVIKINVIKGNEDVSGGSGVGLYLAPILGGIVYNDISVGKITGCEKGIQVNGTLHNTISCNLVHRCNTALEMNGGDHDIINVSIDPNDIAGTVYGARLMGGRESIYTLTWQGNYNPGNALIFGSNSKDNIIYAMGLPLNGVTNNAAIPTNRIVPTKPVGFGITTPTITGNDVYIVNSTCYSVVATIVTPGSVTSWTLRDGNGITETVNSVLLAGQTIYLEPGDSIKFTYSTPPTWAWRALR